MNRRDALQRLGALGLLAAPAGLALAQQTGKGRYLVLDPPVASDTPGKIEVVEFFYYGCPHCREFDPTLREWLKKLPADVVFNRVPATWGGSNSRRVGEARLYYALLALKLVDRLHEKVFVAIQDERLDPRDSDEVGEWASKQGVDAKAFVGAFKSFGVETQVRRAGQLDTMYKIDGVPTMAVGGRYVTSASLLGGSHQETLKEVDLLIAKVRNG
ncbi:MAG: thiol:disulfide interchange protein DsbA/DsbL [Azoarcus sp.]|nr:thiol:disulfide interchange protein DsbA/DsbL [Azoarcus sp.]